eukprot:1159508-Pelagomonas_calceolata.AAC.7
MHARTHSVCQQSVLLHSSGELQVYDLCSRSSGELQGTTCAVPDSSGGSRAFDAEKQWIASNVKRHRSTYLVNDPEFWDVQDSFKRVHR